jgi:hypothetical protein
MGYIRPEGSGLEGDFLGDKEQARAKTSNNHTKLKRTVRDQQVPKIANPSVEMTQKIKNVAIAGVCYSPPDFHLPS